jgi:hypothetical protein
MAACRLLNDNSMPSAGPPDFLTETLIDIPGETII